MTDNNVINLHPDGIANLLKAVQERHGEGEVRCLCLMWLDSDGDLSYGFCDNWHTGWEQFGAVDKLRELVRP